jgi:hypothetical protein
MVGCYRAITLFIVALCPTPVKPKFLVSIQLITAGYHNAYPCIYALQNWHQSQPASTGKM